MRIPRIIAVAAILGIVVLGLWHLVGEWRPSSADYPVQGIDVSAADGLIDWRAARADGVDFAYALATNGADRRDAAFASHWTAMADAGVRRGALMRFSLCAPPQDQADAFVATVPRDADALPAAIDLSIRADCAATPSPDDVAAALTTVIATVERHSGKRVLLKVDRGFEDAYHPSARVPRNVWGVRRFFRPNYLAQPWRIWQASAVARVDGAADRVHWNVVAR